MDRRELVDDPESAWMPKISTPWTASQAI